MTSGKVLLAKTALDGHWRGPMVVAQTLRDAGFEVVLAGMVRASEIATIALEEDVDVVGLNVGGHIAVVLRILDALEEAGVEARLMAGGTIPPQWVPDLEARGVAVFPPGSSLGDIVATAQRLAARPPVDHIKADDRPEEEGAHAQ